MMMMRAQGHEDLRAALFLLLLKANTKRAKGNYKSGQSGSENNEGRNSKGCIE